MVQPFEACFKPIFCSLKSRRPCCPGRNQLAQCTVSASTREPFVRSQFFKIAFHQVDQGSRIPWTGMKLPRVGKMCMAPAYNLHGLLHLLHMPLASLTDKSIVLPVASLMPSRCLILIQSAGHRNGPPKLACSWRLAEHLKAGAVQMKAENLHWLLWMQMPRPWMHQVGLVHQAFCNLSLCPCVTELFCWLSASKESTLLPSPAACVSSNKKQEGML